MKMIDLRQFEGFGAVQERRHPHDLELEVGR